MLNSLEMSHLSMLLVSVFLTLPSPSASRISEVEPPCDRAQTSVMRRLLKNFVCKPPTAVDQLGAAVQVYPHDYFVFGARKRAVGFKYLENAALEADGPVVGNSSRVFKAEDLVEVYAFCHGPVVVFIVLWFLC